MRFYCLGRNINLMGSLVSRSHDEDVVRHECRARDSRVIGVTESPFFLVVLGVTLVTYYVHEIARPNMHEEKCARWAIVNNFTNKFHQEHDQLYKCNRFSRNNFYCTALCIAFLGHDVKEASKQSPLK